jgi:UDP-N-acetylmuramate dehydrogenase
MRLEHSFNIKPLTTFGVNAKIATFIEVFSLEDLHDCRKLGYLNGEDLLVIGGGSNLLFCKNHTGVIIRPALKGITIVEQSENYVIVEAQAGEIWDDLVAFTVDNGFYGLENLSFIPGNVGASPVQNIGAYGVEVQSSIERVEAFEIETGNLRYFTNEECRFGYRESIFKNELKGKYIVTSVRFKLSTKPCLNIEYKDVKAYLSDDKIITLQKVRDAIISIRKAKLPDPAIIGNAGSFFKNPVISASKADYLKQEFPAIVMYPIGDGSQKLAAGWLIDKAGWKGFRRGDAGVHPTQALVLVNYGHATGNEILALAHEIQESVLKLFGVEISPEVRIVQ